jgi:hypothetical protein
VIIDPLVAFHERNEISATQIRGLLRSLGSLASEFDVAITVVQHPNKNAEAKDLYRVRGTLDFIAAVRAVLRVSVGKEGTRVLSVDKTNLARRPPSCGFIIREDRRVEWVGEVLEDTGRSKLDVAKEFLQWLLKNGPVESNDVRHAAKAEGVGWRTVQRARAEMPIRTRKASSDGPWVWELEIQDTEAVSPADSTDEVVL